MNLLERFTKDLSSRRAQHLVYLLHVWICVPFLILWVADPHTRNLLGPDIVRLLLILVVVMLAYMAIRTWLAFKDPPGLKWWFVFPPIDVMLITLILLTTQRGPMSNITLLYFLPMVQASGTLNVRWSAAVGLMVVVGTALATLTADPGAVYYAPTSVKELLRNDPLNVGFRVTFLLVISSLMAYQALIAAGYRERLGVAADRNRIAMDMHDGVQGHLISIASQLELISLVAEKDGKRAAELAQQGRESARQAADELRYLVQRLRTPTPSSGFVGALRQYAHNLCDRNGLSLTFEVTGPEASLAPDLENAIFRIAQEALTNVIKHAKAHSVSITVNVTEGKTCLTMADDGLGFDPALTAFGVGLEGMGSRASANGGELVVESKPGAGTRVCAEFSLGADDV
jgi:signal transduction histidine kinase